MTYSTYSTAWMRTQLLFRQLRCNLLLRWQTLPRSRDQKTKRDSSVVLVAIESIHELLEELCMPPEPETYDEPNLLVEHLDIIENARITAIAEERPLLAKLFTLQMS